MPTILPTLFFGCVTEFDYYTTTVVYAFESFSLTLFSPQLRPSGALFLDQLTTTEASLTLNYTIVANDLSLDYPNIIGMKKDQFTEALDTHQRYHGLGRPESPLS